MITKDKLREIRAKMAPILKELGGDFNVDLSLGNASFSQHNFTLQLKGSAISETGEIITKEADNFQRYAYMFGLAASDLGKTFKLNGCEYVITGLKPNAHKYPILCKASNGTEYKMTAAMVANGLDKTNPRFSR